ncbi:uncharacterized protein LOC112348435 isoform X2 [Selaginella moellendorffii]|uniref:uncharacterized protein LOC112348435 isoform X2 n=1 Tax=Selaginella moellendorffii TaxID=88036 RepID=UPI000D1C3F05|nr:uncharacterized protein LOC112348435 isoform X2 [Selaginella moellendorffii]|eukprot:XP_024536664.1 uncharacterized protein LOC112348435 isoform X2 [Selaginella moellendorffii]
MSECISKCLEPSQSATKLLATGENIAGTRSPNNPSRRVLRRVNKERRKHKQNKAQMYESLSRRSLFALEELKARSVWRGKSEQKEEEKLAMAMATLSSREVFKAGD